jgi:hypothetical protein
MPSATPLPSGPSHVALFGADDLLRPDGCPVCRYVTDAGDRFLAWFALEAHADPDLLTQICRSLGFCAVHTTGMLSQPGADHRMTAVYSYLLRAAARFLAEGASPTARCLSCTRDDEAAERVIDTLLAGLQEPGTRDRYGAAHGLCLPHLRAAAPRAGRRLTAWLARDTLARLSAAPPGLALLTGDPAQLPPVRSGICRACVMAYRPERDASGNPGSPSAGAVRGSPSAGLCPAHLREAGSGPGAVRLLAAEGERALAWLTAAASPPRGLAGLAATASAPGAVARRAGRGRRQPDDCPACRSAGTPGEQAVRALHAAEGQPQLCLRHVIALRDRDPRAAEPFIRPAADRTRALLAELEEAARKRSWQHRHEPRGPEMTAWRCAASLVDGRV